MTNTELVERLIREHPEGLDDDELATLSGVQPRQQIHQICSRLALAGRLRRESVEKPGKRRKIHSFPVARAAEGVSAHISSPSAVAEPIWRMRLKALVAVTTRSEEELLDDALREYAVKVLKAHHIVTRQAPS